MSSTGIDEREECQTEPTQIPVDAVDGLTRSLRRLRAAPR
jgi:hypothetical protein